ncbi:MAG: hypothetical protein CL870_03160 [Cytophagia bacterium]|nr:hypothetical protein [Cytophagia bacterium]|tara:strand:+ start:1891 stop:2301 length:411 start_codon:yes stop_codon:yes gene_type:complete
MKDIIKKNKINLLFNVTEALTGVNRKDIVSKKRNKQYILPRHIVGYMLHKELEITMMESGRLVGRDHSTVHHYVSNYDDNMKFYKEFRNLYEIISESYWSQIMEADVKDLSLELKQLQNLIDTLNAKKKKLLTLNK